MASTAARTRWFGHVDMDAFYASVEVLDRPELAGVPLAVGGRSEHRGVIAAASYPARVFGVRSAMPTAEAFRRCPDLVLVPGRMERYAEVSREVMDILRDVAPAVEPLSLDEAALDLTGCARLHGAADGDHEDWTGFARRLRRRIRRETGLWGSIGLGETRRIAKIASDLRKPRGVAVVEAGAGPGFLTGLPIERLWGVGPKMRERLRAAGMHTVADVVATPRAELGARFGKMGPALHDAVHARESGTVDPDRPHKSVSHETTFSVDRVGSEELEPVLLALTEKVATRLRRAGLVGRVVQLKIRDRGFHTFTRRRSLAAPTDSETTIYEAGRRLLRSMGWNDVPVRLVGIGVSDLTSQTAHQGDLFASTAERQRPQLEQALDAVHARFGEKAIGHARSVLDPLRARDGVSWLPTSPGLRARTPHPSTNPIDSTNPTNIENAASDDDDRRSDHERKS